MGITRSGLHGRGDIFSELQYADFERDSLHWMKNYQQNTLCYT